MQTKDVRAIVLGLTRTGSPLPESRDARGGNSLIRVATVFAFPGPKNGTWGTQAISIRIS